MANIIDRLTQAPQGRSLSSLLAESCVVLPLADAYSLAGKMLRLEISHHIQVQREALGFTQLDENQKAVWLRFEAEVTLTEVAEVLVGLANRQRTIPDLFSESAESCRTAEDVAQAARTFQAKFAHKISQEVSDE